MYITSENDAPVTKRNMCQRNIKKIIDKVNMVNWAHVTDSENAQEAYTLCHAKLSDIYSACFPFTKVKKEISYYRNRLNHVLRAAERKYCQNLINEHKSNVKNLGKSWKWLSISENINLYAKSVNTVIRSLKIDMI